MNRPGERELYAVCEATWPPKARSERAGWHIRDGDGGGKRVSAATLSAPGAELPAIEVAEVEMRALGQAPLFMVRAGEDELDAALAARGYDVIDPVNIWLAPAERLADRPIPSATTFCVWEPLQIMRDIWAEGGIGPARQRVMERAEGPKTGILGRAQDKPAAVAFVAVSAGVAMLHALEVRRDLRRHGMGAWVMRQAAHWALDQGAPWLSVICTRANGPANALYSALGMERVGQYHYRIASQGVPA